MSQAKALGTLILLIVIASVGWFIKSQADEIGTLKTTVGTQKSVIDGHAKAVKLDKGSDAIDNAATHQAAQGVTVIHAQAQATEDKSKTNEAAIRRKYEKLIAEAKERAAQTPSTAPPPEVPGLEREKAQAISANRLDGLWEEYCRDNATCGSPPTN